MKLSSKYSAVPQNIINNSAKDLKRKISSYLFKTKNRSMEELLLIIQDHAAEFITNFEMRYLRETTDDLGKVFNNEKIMRFFDVLEKLNGVKFRGFAEETMKDEQWNCLYNEDVCEFTIASVNYKFLGVFAELRWDEVNGATMYGINYETTGNTNLPVKPAKQSVKKTVTKGRKAKAKTTKK